MRRTARALSVVFAAGAALALAGPAALADPAAEASPGTVLPGGTVTVSVTCDAVTGPAPQTLDAASPGFEGGTAHLTRVTGDADQETGATGLAYRGTARVAADAKASDAPTGGQAADADIGGQAADADIGGQAAGDPADAEAEGDSVGAEAAGDPASAEGDSVGAKAADDPADADADADAEAGGDSVGAEAEGDPADAEVEGDPAGTDRDAAWTVDGTCPAATGRTGRPWSATYTVAHGDDGGACAEPGPCGGTQVCEDAEPCGDDGRCREGASCQEEGSCQENEACPDRSPCQKDEDEGSRGASCTDGGGRCEESHGGACPDGRTCREPQGTGGCGQASVQRGVEAGAGGIFDDSLPALAAGGVFMAAGCGAAAYRVYGRRRSAGGRPTGL
ncbi:hypothetical protein [Streptomyces sp. NPDC048521]|uniref:hypothetical protein n=1 Tax=Streptomyces sp. NPDC048521 TaxID=3365566 RepID=UPI0037151E51